MRKLFALALLMAGPQAEAESAQPLPPQQPPAAASRAAVVPLPVPRPPDPGPEPHPQDDARTGVPPLPPPRPAALNSPVYGPAAPPGAPAAIVPAPNSSSAPAATPPSAFTIPMPGIHDGAPSLIPGAFPVDQMDAACTRVLASGKILASRVNPIVGHDGCGIAFPIELRAIVGADGQPIELRPPPVLRCDLAETLADWVRDDVGTLGAERGRLVGVADAAAYVCRGRNNVLGASMSEHGRGDAIDILGFSFAKENVGLRQDDAHALWAQVKTSTCARFKTVLGPGSDGYHENNLHLDLEDRRNGSHYCHWDNP